MALTPSFAHGSCKCRLRGRGAATLLELELTALHGAIVAVSVVALIAAGILVMCPRRRRNTPKRSRSASVFAAPSNVMPVARVEDAVSRSPQIGVDLDGDLIGEGALTFPPDSEGRFPIVDADEIKFASRRGRVWLAPCRSWRDPSGFLRSEEVGAALYLPPTFVSALKTALKIGVTEPVELSYSGQAGALSDSSSMLRGISQELTNWRMTIDRRNDGIEARISAELHATSLLENFPSRQNFWADQPGPSQLEARLTIDDVTRVACFGAYVPELEDEKAEAAALPPLFHTLDVRRAPVGQFHIFGLDRDEWIYVYDTSGRHGYDGNYPALTFAPHPAPSRSRSGLLQDRSAYGWPRVSIYGVTLDLVASSMREKLAVRLQIEGDAVGELTWFRNEPPAETITAADLHFAIDVDGLAVRCEIKAGSTRSYAFRLSWELLLLRYPEFARLRARLA